MLNFVLGSFALVCGYCQFSALCGVLQKKNFYCLEYIQSQYIHRSQVASSVEFTYNFPTPENDCRWQTSQT